ncbi:MAG: hypothetical protein ACI9QD_000259, partial [Thermoproteota archaeon]
KLIVLEKNNLYSLSKKCRSTAKVSYSYFPAIMS